MGIVRGKPGRPGLRTGIQRTRYPGADGHSQRVKKRRGGDTLEIDVLVVNAGHVVVEVKASLNVADVREFLDDLGRAIVERDIDIH